MISLKRFDRKAKALNRELKKSKHKETTCPTGKVGYRHERQAQNQIEHGLTREMWGSTGKRPVRYYLCEHCDRFHLTSWE